MKVFPLPSSYPAQFTTVLRWPIPAGIRLERHALVCEPLPEQCESLAWVINPKGRLLTEFCDLRDATDEQIEAFASEWGMLALCRNHPLPAGHHYGRECQAAWREPLERWRAASAYIAALRSLGHAVQTGEAGELEDWRLVLDPEREDEWADAIAGPKRMETYLIALDYMVRQWAQLRPVMVWDDGFRLLFGSGSHASALPAAIGYEALAWLLGARGILICGECAAPFESERVRSPDRSAFCPSCRSNGAAIRAASRNYYRKQKKNREREKGDGTKA